MSVSNHARDTETTVEQSTRDEEYQKILRGAQEIAAINESMRNELRGIDATLRHVKAELNQQKAYAAKLKELLRLRAQLDTVRPQPAPTEDVDDGAFAGHSGRHCGEHRPAGARAWCADCSEWCSAEMPCGGCERPYLYDEVERLQAELASWRTTFGESALRDRIAATEAEVSAFEACQQVLRCTGETIADLQAQVEALPEWRCPRCGATTRARLADVQERSDAD